MKRIFKVNFELYGWHVSFGIIELDQRVIDQVDDEWREVFYRLYTPEDIVAHIAYNLFINKVRKVSSLDGWADLEEFEPLAQILEYPDLDDFDIIVEEKEKWRR